MLQTSIDLQADRNGKYGEAMQVVGCAIEWVDDPNMVRLTLDARFFGMNGMVRIVLMNYINGICTLTMKLGNKNLLYNRQTHSIMFTIHKKL